MTRAAALLVLCLAWCATSRAEEVAAEPGGRTTSTVVSLEVGPIAKCLRVWGDRRWQGGAARWNLGDPQPFTRVPLCYEHAIGGAVGEPGSDGVWDCDMRNPVGRGYGASRARQDGDLAANTEYEDGRDAPAGFGPLPPNWQPRAGYAGTYDDAWQANRFPLPPDDLDNRFYNAAPADQQSVNPLVGGESVRLQNLTADGLWAFTLPRVWLVLNTQVGEHVRAHRAMLQTVMLHPDERQVVMTWVSTLRCQGHAHKLRRVHVREKPRVALGTPVTVRAVA